VSDLVDRLRRWTHAVDAAPASDLMDEAAGEIERLRLTVDERQALERLIPQTETYNASDQRLVRCIAWLCTASY
jgi:hypothetical protein